MTAPIFDHEKLDVYLLSLEYVAEVFGIAGALSGLHRHSRDQWLRAAQSIPLNIAEGNGKRSLKDRSRFFDIARGSALECAAIQDVLVISNALCRDRSDSLKERLKRVVAMLTRLAMRADQVGEGVEPYHAGVDYDYEHEHRFAEHEL
jgi:four helix bundle protein